MTVKHWELLVSIWVRDIDEDSNDKIQSWLRNALGFSEKIEFRFKMHPQSAENKLSRKARRITRKKGDDYEKATGY